MWFVYYPLLILFCFHDAQRWAGSLSRAVSQVPIRLVSPATCVICVWETPQENPSVRREKTCMMDTTVPSGTETLEHHMLASPFFSFNFTLTFTQHSSCDCLSVRSGVWRREMEMWHLSSTLLSSKTLMVSQAAVLYFHSFLFLHGLNSLNILTVLCWRQVTRESPGLQISSPGISSCSVLRALKPRSRSTNTVTWLEFPPMLWWSGLAPTSTTSTDSWTTLRWESPQQSTESWNCCRKIWNPSE